MARDRGEPEAGGGRERRQLAQQVPHVRLVPVRRCRPSTSASTTTSGVMPVPARRRRSSRVGGALPRVVPGTLEAERNELVSLPVGVSIPAAIDATSSGSTRTAASPATSSIAPPALVTTGVPHAIASSTGNAEALVERREDERSVRRGRAARAPRPRPCRPRRGRPGTPPHLPRADDPQLDTGAGGRLDDPLEVLARLERPDGEHVVALGCVAVRVKTGSSPFGTTSTRSGSTPAARRPPAS